jgi:hypothetical protein
VAAGVGANDNDPSAPMARYFVIHDTSGPNFGHRAFPEEVDNGNFQDQQPEQIQMLGRLGQGACRHQPIRRPAAQSRTRDSLARDQVRAGGEFLQNHFLEWNLSSGRFALLHGIAGILFMSCTAFRKHSWCSGSHWMRAAALDTPRPVGWALLQQPADQRQ